MGLKVVNILEEGRWGGPQARVMAVAEKLREQGIETTVFLPKNGSQVYRQKLKARYVPFVPLRLHGLSRDLKESAMYVLLFFPELITLIRLLRRREYDVVHCNGAWQIKGVIAARLLCMKVIWHLNDTRRVRVLQSISELLCRYFCDYVIFASRKTRTFYVGPVNQVGSCEIQAPVDTAAFDPQVVHIKEEHQRKVIIVTTGNINPSKGLEYFIEMASLLNRKLTNLEFIIIGNFFGRQRRYKRDLMALSRRLQVDNLRFVQNVHDVRPYLKMASIYVCASVHEASPISLWEAMSMEKPVVTTDVGDVSSFVKDGESGFVVPLRDPRSLAEKVERLVSEPGLRSTFGKRARQMAIDTLDLEICAEKHAEVYKSVAMHRSGRTEQCIS